VRIGRVYLLPAYELARVDLANREADIRLENVIPSTPWMPLSDRQLGAMVAGREKRTIYLLLSFPNKPGIIPLGSVDVHPRIDK
jgi:hypothetical protein